MNDLTTKQYPLKEWFTYDENYEHFVEVVRRLIEKGVTFKEDLEVIYLVFPQKIKSRKVFDSYHLGEIRPIEEHDRLYDEWEIRNNPSEAYKWVLDLEEPFRYFETPWDMSGQDICWTVSDCLHSVNHYIGIEPHIKDSFLELLKKIEKE